MLGTYQGNGVYAAFFLSRRPFLKNQKPDWEGMYVFNRYIFRVEDYDGYITEIFRIAKLKVNQKIPESLLIIGPDIQLPPDDLQNAKFFSKISLN